MSQRLTKIESHLTMTSSSASSNTLEHPTLGCTLRGHASPTAPTTQFRNLKYATFPARYKDSVPVDGLEPGKNGIYDATKFGPSSPHLRGSQKWDLTLTGSNLTTKYGPGQGDEEAMDEFECLHVNVTVPNAVLSNDSNDTTKGLPVFVWVHGGGLCIGSNSWPQYDLQHMVARSIAINKPCITVAMNYRLGTFGFLASPEIGANGNMGYKDQMLAFRWVRKHIAGFGGDPNDITAAGESAGGISLSTLLCADVVDEQGRGLFDRVVIMSGDATLRKSRNRWWHQKMYEQQGTLLGLNKGDEEGLRKILLEGDAIELAQKLPIAQHTSACVDGDWLTEDANLAVMSDGKHKIHKPDWCKEFVIGDTAHDATVLRGRIVGTPDALERLKHVCGLYLTKAETQNILEAYKLHGKPSGEKKERIIMALASEMRFYQPSMVCHQGWKDAGKLASRYHVHCPNPFEGMNHDIASHELDVIYMLQNCHEQLDERNQKIALNMADQMIQYINGEGWVEDGQIIVYGYDGIITVPEDEYDQKYRGGRGAVLRSIDAHKLWQVADAWAKVRAEEEETMGARFETGASTVPKELSVK